MLAAPNPERTANDGNCQALVGLSEAVVSLVRDGPNPGYRVGAWIDFRYSTRAPIFSFTLASE
jgi:hypothetical protein